MGSGEDKLNLFLEVIKTVPLTVKTSTTVRNVKRMLNDKEGISECLQDFFFNGRRLKDHQKLVHCGIQQNSMLQVVVPLRLFIKLPSNQKTIEVKAGARDTIQNVKSLIVAKVGIGLPDFNLIHAGKLLEDDKSLASLDIQGESTLHMMIAPREMLKISVRMPTGEVLMLEVKMLYKVGDVKTIVESIVGFPVNGLILTYDGMQLEDSENLSRYDIAEGSILEMVTKSVQVFVRKGCGRTVTVDLCLEDSVVNLKEKIFLKLGIPTGVQRLAFEGKYLKDDRNLASYNIQRDSTLHLTIWGNHHHT